MCHDGFPLKVSAEFLLKVHAGFPLRVPAG